MPIRHFFALERRLKFSGIKPRRRAAMFKAAAVVLPMLAPASAPAAIVIGTVDAGSAQEGDVVTITLDSNSPTLVAISGNLTIAGDNVPPDVTGVPSVHSYTPLQDGTYDWAASGSLTDENETSTWSTDGSFTIFNVAPTIESAALNGVNDNLTVNEGDAVGAQLTSNDPGADGHTFGVDVDFGTQLDAGSDASTSGTRSSQTVDVTQANDGVFTINFAATDDAETTYASRTLTVNNVAPEIVTASLDPGNGAVFGDLTVPEGTDVTAAMSSMDSGADAHEYLIDNQDAGDDGNTSGLRQSQAVYVTRNQDGVYPIDFSVTDDHPEQPTATSLTLTVTNVAPTITSATLNGIDGDLTVNEGDAVTGLLASIDPGADGHAFAINNVNAGVDPTTSGTRTSTSVDLTQADDAEFDVEFSATDDDETTTQTRRLTVLNVAPEFTASPLDDTLDFSVTSEFSFYAEASDPGVNDVLSYAWDLDGDGDHDDFTGPSGTFDFASLMLEMDADLDLAVRVDDGDGGADLATFRLSVINVAAVPEASSLLFLTAAGTVACALRRRCRGVS